MAEARPRTKRKPDPKPVEAERPPPVCQVAFCPICMAVTTLGEVKPELLEHLLLAGREILLALRAAIDTRLEGQEKAVTKLERLKIE
jgi:hypothetical protein